MPSLESWEKLGEEEKAAAEEGLVLSVEGGEEETKDLPIKLKKRLLHRRNPRGRPFEKIELEDILEKVGRMELPPEREQPAERGSRSERRTAPIQEVDEKPFAFDEFEIALQKGVEVEVQDRNHPKQNLSNLFPLKKEKRRL